MIDQSSNPMLHDTTPMLLPRGVEQLREQHRELAARGFVIPERLVITCVEPSIEHLVPRIAPSLRVRMRGLRVDRDVRETLEVAVRELGVRSVAVLAHTQCRHLGDCGEGAAGLRVPREHRGFGAYDRLRAGAWRTARRFAEVRAGVRAFCLDLRLDPSLLAPDGRQIACFGVIYAVESGATHLFAPGADQFEVLE